MSFYHHIRKKGRFYEILKNSEIYGSYENVEDALYDRDRLIKVNWDWDLFVEMVDTPNFYYQIDLPPFDKQPKYVSHVRERWQVWDGGNYRGSYLTEEEAKKVARIYNSKIYHKKEKWCVTKSVNGYKQWFGQFDTEEEALAKVKELEEEGWDKK